jgi:hypothetical protein
MGQPRRNGDAAHREALRAHLLRDTYRLDPGAHAAVHAQLACAMANAWASRRPATLYQSPGQDMNAALLYVPGEIHIVLQGPLLERLAPDELLAVFGHELAHYLLWSHGRRRRAGGRPHPGRLPRAAAAPSHLETWRRHVLHTELFADRGAAIAAGAGPAIAALVKVQTGIGTVDPRPTCARPGKSKPCCRIRAARPATRNLHPRPRAGAVVGRRPGLDDWIEARLRGPLSLENLDLPDQLRLQALGRGFLAHYLDGAGPASEAVLAQLRLLFPDWQAETPAGPEALRADAGRRQRARLAECADARPGAGRPGAQGRGAAARRAARPSNSAAWTT